MNQQQDEHQASMQSKPGIVSGQCHWQHGTDASRLVDEAGVVWQTHYRNSVADTWSGSLQRHETCGDNF